MMTKIHPWAVLVAGLATGGCSDDGGELSQALGAVNNLAVLSVSVPARVAPSNPLAVVITARNTGTASWSPNQVRLAFTGVGGWSNANLTLAATTAPNQVGTFSGTLGASTQIGRYPLAWQAQKSGAAFGAPLAASTEVTCSDSVFCNGDERYVNGNCVGGPLPCDDGAACTTDRCDEPSLRCDHTLGADCAACAVKNCNPNCHGALCGDDGCGGSCGACAGGQICADGVCVVANIPGTCNNPLPVVAGADPNAALAPGYYVATGDTSNGFNEAIPTCNSASTAKEKIYKLVVNQPMGLDAQSYDFDTVLHIRAGGCGGATVGCSDDAAPPGGYGSHVAVMLNPGTYFIIVDGFDDHAFGPYHLALRLVAGCLPQCDGKFCGDDGCGGSCGDCGPGQLCSASARCVANPCQPACHGRQCGTDGCGGSCGTCQAGKACDEVTGACKNVSECDNDRPVCLTKCSSTQYCGSDCRCHRAQDPRPDLVVNRLRLQNEILFETLNISPTSCAIVERCVGGSGARKLLRFSVEAVNQGQTTLTVPPPKTRPDLFQYSPCHGHYHFSGFASYALLDPQGKVVITGQKQAYCMEDTVQVLYGPTLACNKKYDCENQGIQAGWSDLYGNALDCQWLDVTGIAPGSYQLQVTLNPNRAFEEVTFDNNVATVPVVIQ